ncbi:MAG TPA: hypothetical protein VNS46_19195 [Nocardioides sp.]|nr:hypothetical protein [Nocardioides sp.]
MRRLLRRTAAALGVILLWLAGSLAVASTPAGSVRPGEERRGAGDAASSAPAVVPAPRTRRAPDVDLGVQLSAHHGSRVRYADDVMRRLASASAGWVRVDVGWTTLQPAGAGPFEQWYADLIDRVLASADRHGLRVILMLWLTPPWASPDGSPYAPPTDPASYGRAIGRAAQRWGDAVDAWEVWNEPNFPTFFEGADPATYTDLLCSAYPAVKEHDADPVLFGGIMYNDDDWLRRAYRAGVRDCFDALATHPYLGPSDAPPETPSVGAIWRLTSTPMVREVMTAWGDARKDIWITELGWSSGPENDGNSWDRAVTTAQQADYLARAVALVRRDYPYVGPIIWYRDVDGPTRRYQDGFGLMHPDLSSKPAMRAFRESARGR